MKSKPQFSKKDRILITGGTGFIGTALAKKCLESTLHVTCLGLAENNKQRLPSSIELLCLDLQNKNKLKSKLDGRAFEYVINLGGYIDHALYFLNGRKNIDSHFIGLLNLLDCLNRKNLKGFVQIGSSDEYGNVPAPQNETMREMPISPYSLAKVASTHFMQMLSRTENFPVTILRFFLVYGPGQDDRRFVPQIIKSCLKDEEFKISKGKQLRDFCYIDDVVKAIIKAALFRRFNGSIINIGSGKAISIKEITEKIMKIASGGKPLWGSHPYRKNENMRLYADISLARNILKWEPKISLDEGLKKTISYYKNVLETT